MNTALPTILSVSILLTLPAGADPIPDREPRLASGIPEDQPKVRPSPPGPETQAEPVDLDPKCRPLPAKGRVRMNFNRAKVLDIVQWISEQTCKNFILSKGVEEGEITILSNTPVSSPEAYRAFLAALDANAMTVVRAGAFLKVQRKQDATRNAIPTYVGPGADLPELDLMVTRLLSLQHVDAATAAGTLGQLISKEGSLQAYGPTNSLILTDTASNVNRLTRLLAQLDTPMGQEEIRVVQVEHAAAVDLAASLEEVFGQQAQSRGASPRPQRSGRARARAGATQVAGAVGQNQDPVRVSRILADERTNQLVIIAPARSFDRVQELIDKLDVPVSGDGQLHVVALQHAKAEDLAQTLTALASGSQARPARNGGQGPGRKARGATGASFSGQVRITAEPASNTLIILAGQSDLRSLRRVLAEVDVPRRQVFVEVVIMEVGLDTERDVGMAFHAGETVEVGGETIPLVLGTQLSSQGQSLSSLSMLNSLNLLGFMSGIQGPALEGAENILGSVDIPAFGVVLQALQTDSHVDVLSTPHLLTTDKEEAEIKVGKNIPLPTGYNSNSTSALTSLAAQSSTSSATSGLSALLNTGIGGISRQEVGMTLKVTPQINEGDFVQLEIEAELSEVTDTTDALGATFTNRSVRTVVVVEDQQTVVVGGLMRDRLEEGVSKVPVLGDIPILGWLFRSKYRSKIQTNLLLVLTPYVINSRADFRAIYERKIRERREFLERYQIGGQGYKRVVDFRRKHGPLADVHLVMTRELARVENGGPGLEGEILITPALPANRNRTTP